MCATAKNELCEAPEEYVARPKATTIIKNMGTCRYVANYPFHFSDSGGGEVLVYLKHSKRCVFVKLHSQNTHIN